MSADLFLVEMVRRSGLIVLIVFLFASPVVGKAEDKAAYSVYLNADMTHTTDVGESLRLGLEAGLRTGARRYAGPNLSVIVQDHQNNLRRTARTIEQAHADARLVAIVGGMHSPHYFKHGPDINRRQIILLLPWSAGGALTRLAEGSSNFIFRVSVDDTKAAPFLAKQAKSLRCRQAGVIALDNGWGHGNVEALERRLPAEGVRLVHRSFVRRDSGADTIASAIAKMERARPDCVLFVLSAHTSAYAANALLAWETPPLVLSHWGILGGGYRDAVQDEVWQDIDLAVLSTCILEAAIRRSNQLETALSAASEIEPGVETLDDIPSPTAFAHAYDLGLILAASVQSVAESAGWMQGGAERTAALRDGLHSLDVGVEGVLKTYWRPFHPVSSTSRDGHDALGEGDLCLVNVEPNGTLVPFARANAP